MVPHAPAGLLCAAAAAQALAQPGSYGANSRSASCRPTRRWPAVKSPAPNASPECAHPGPALSKMAIPVLQNWKICSTGPEDLRSSQPNSAHEPAAPIRQGGGCVRWLLYLLCRTARRPTLRTDPRSAARRARVSHRSNAGHGHTNPARRSKPGRRAGGSHRLSQLSFAQPDKGWKRPASTPTSAPTCPQRSCLAAAGDVFAEQPGGRRGSAHGRCLPRSGSSRPPG